MSNVPLFIKDELLITELSGCGKIVSQMRKVSLGCKSPLLKHVISFRWQVFMVLKSEMEELNVAFKFKIDGFDYVVFASSETMKCFTCGEEGHSRSLCPEKTEDASANTAEAVDDVVRVAEHEQVKNVSATAEVRANDEGMGGSEMAKGEILNETDKTTDAMMEEEINAEYVSDDALFKTPSVKRKRNKEIIGNEKSKQLSAVVVSNDAEKHCY